MLGEDRPAESNRRRCASLFLRQERCPGAEELSSTRLRVVGVVVAFTLLEAWRSRLPVLVGVFAAAAFIGAGLVEEMALTEAAETRNILQGAMLRICAVVALGLFMVTSVLRDGTDQVVELVLSQPRPRADYYFGKLVAGAILAAGVAALCGLGLLPHAPPRPVLLWSLSLTLELWMVVAAGLFCALAFRHVVCAFLPVIAFYLLARTIGALRLLSESPLTASPGWSDAAVDVLVGVLYHLLPDLGRYTLSDWLVYPSAEMGELLPLAAQAVCYVALLSGAALFDLYRRNL